MNSVAANHRKVSLGDICEFKYGKSLPASARVPGSYPVYGSNGSVGFHEEALTTGPTIIVGRKGSVGEVSFSSTPCWPIDTTYFVDPSCTEQDIRWLARALSTLRLDELNKAAAVPGLNREDAYRQKLLLPKRSEQRRVTAILDEADALRAKRRAALAKLDDLGRAIFVSMFGDLVSNRRGLPLVRVNEITECLDYARRPIKAAERAKGNVPYYGANGPQGFIDRPLFDEPLVLVAEDGGYFDEPERGVAYRIDGPAWVNNHAHILRPMPGRLNVEYLHRALKHYNFLPHISGTTRAKLTQAQLNSAKILLPPFAEQQLFARRVEAVVETASASQRALAELDVLFASLQHRAFRGEL